MMIIIYQDPVLCTRDITIINPLKAFFFTFYSNSELNNTFYTMLSALSFQGLTM